MQSIVPRMMVLRTVFFFIRSTFLNHKLNTQCLYWLPVDSVGANQNKPVILIVIRGLYVYTHTHTFLQVTYHFIIQYLLASGPVKPHPVSYKDSGI